MCKTTKILLTLAVAGLVSGLAFVTGLVKVEGAAWLYVALPAGAICFGLFLISKLLEKESALFDEEQRLLLAAARSAAGNRAPIAAPQKRCGSEGARTDSLVSINAS